MLDVTVEKVKPMSNRSVHADIIGVYPAAYPDHERRRRTWQTLRDKRSPRIRRS